MEETETGSPSISHLKNYSNSREHSATSRTEYVGLLIHYKTPEANKLIV